MSHCHYTPSRRLMSMAELNHSKTLNMRLADHLRSIAEELNDQRYASQAERVKYCSTFWNGFFCPSCGKYHGMHTTGCRHRLCPICATKISRVTAIQAVEAINLIRDRRKSKVDMSLLTLTQRNVCGDDLPFEIGNMLKAWNYICNQRKIRYGIIGWARTIEIVPGINQDGTYHPHVHAIILHDPGKCPSVEWFQERWKVGLKLDYLPVCDLRPIEDEDGAIFEVSKYVSKMTRVYDNSAHEHDHVKYMTQAMNNRRLRSYGGEWRKARMLLGQMQAEDMDDDGLDEYGEALDLTGECPNCGTGTIETTLRWAGLKYVKIPDDIRVIPMDSLLS